jgi:hypothetical protein
MHAFLTSSTDPHTWQNWLLLQAISCPLMSMSARGFMLMHACGGRRGRGEGGHDSSTGRSDRQDPAAACLLLPLPPLSLDYFSTAEAGAQLEAVLPAAA